MKAVPKTLGMLFVAAGIFLCTGYPAEPAEVQEYKLSTDPRLAVARESFEKAQEYMEKGNQEFRRRPGLAQKLFEHAEDYYLKAVFYYRELGEKYGIDASHEIAVCERLYRQAHVKVGKSRRKRKRPGAAY